MENPYSLVFGKMPSNFIERENELNEIVETFAEKEPSVRSYALVGLRGCGKTVALSYIEKCFREKKDFVVVSLNSDLDLFEQTLEALTKKSLLDELKVNISILGIGIEKKHTTESVNSQIEDCLNMLTKKNKRVLFSIDEISNTKNIKLFFQAFNVWLRKDYDVTVVMAGLKKNILNLQKDDRVSFLKRVEKKSLKNLALTSVMKDYHKNLKVSEELASEMARFTLGYSYAFQVLGYLCFRENKHYTELLDQFDEKMTNNVYDIIWEDLTLKEKEIVAIMVNSDSMTTKDIANQVGKNTYNQYRNILISKDIIVDKGYGKIDFTLPRFKEIAKKQIALMLWEM